MTAHESTDIKGSIFLGCKEASHPKKMKHASELAASARL